MQHSSRLRLLAILLLPVVCLPVERVGAQPLLTIGGTGADDGICIATRTDSPGTLLVAGTTRSFGGYYDACLFQLEGDSILKAVRAGGQGGNEDEQANAIVLWNNLAILVGYSGGAFTGGGGGSYLTAIDISSGTQTWTTALSTPTTDALTCAVVLPSGILYAAGYRDTTTHRQALLIKVNPSTGALLRSFELGGTAWDETYALTHSGDTLYMSGATNSIGAGNYDVLVAAFREADGLLWSRTFGMSGWDRGFGAVASGGYIYIAGESYSLTATSDLLVIKIDENSGALQWAKLIGWTNTSEKGYAIATDANKNLIIAGNRDSAGSSDIMVLRMDSHGNLKWLITVNSGGNDYLSGTQAITQTPDDGRLVVVGTTDSFSSGAQDILVFSIDTNGKTPCTYLQVEYRQPEIDSNITALLQVSNPGWIATPVSFPTQSGGSAFPVTNYSHKNLTISLTVNINTDSPTAGSNTTLWAEINGGVPPYQVLWSTGDSTDTIIVQQPGIYWVLVSDSKGCIASDTFVITGTPSFAPVPAQQTPECTCRVLWQAETLYPLLHCPAQQMAEITVFDMKGQQLATTFLDFSKQYTYPLTMVPSPPQPLLLSAKWKNQPHQFILCY